MKRRQPNRQRAVLHQGKYRHVYMFPSQHDRPSQVHFSRRLSEKWNLRAISRPDCRLSARLARAVSVWRWDEETGADPGTGPQGRDPFPSKRRPVVLALVCRLQCFPKGTIYQIALITQCGSSRCDYGGAHKAFIGASLLHVGAPIGLRGAPIGSRGAPIATKGTPQSTCSPSPSKVLDPPVQGDEPAKVTSGSGGEYRSYLQLAAAHLVISCNLMRRTGHTAV